MSKNNVEVSIIGNGHVGKGMRDIFPDAVVFDKYQSLLNGSQADVNKCRLSIICVPTPAHAGDGSCDISIVEEVVAWTETPLILIKSAVPPGTTDYLRTKYNKRITVSPEYFGESTYNLSDVFSPLGWPYLIIGGKPEDTREVMKYFLTKLGPSKVFRQTDARTAELTKYMENTWFCTQVIFANEFARIADRLGVDYLELRELWGLDPRVSKSHTLVFEERPGFGGKCLPKDITAIIACAKSAGYKPEFLEAVWQSNLRFQSANGLKGNQATENREDGNGISGLPDSRTTKILEGNGLLAQPPRDVNAG